MRLMKGSKTKLTHGLTSDEFDCKCELLNCVSTEVSRILIASYRKLRYLHKAPLKINSGYRCAPHNDAIGGTKGSQHLFGRAIDISLENIEDKEAFADLARDCGFTYIKLYSTFIHLDVRKRS